MAILKRRCGACDRGMTRQQEQDYDQALRIAFEARRQQNADAETQLAAQKATEKVRELLKKARG
ncbi:MAG: hypothetical protein ACRC8Y_21940 [Chroococcales cyanobacterium]